jgi:His-Xaa-Ser system radical SAM maturase HxsB
VTPFPLKFRRLTDGSILFSNDAGDFFVSGEQFLRRYTNQSLTETDYEFLSRRGLAFTSHQDVSFTAYAWRWAARQSLKKSLSYIILVPTLRCDLTCSYCQVSRAPLNSQGFDWSPETEEGVLNYLNTLETTSIKVEFQGGEPTLRLDILTRVRDFCRRRFSSSSFVVCTNLQSLTPELLTFLRSPDTVVSTSLDGDAHTHLRNRTHQKGRTDQFFRNLDVLVKELGPGQISALPTIDVEHPPNFKDLIQLYASYGFSSLYFRPINYQGFARRVRARREDSGSAIVLYRQFLQALFDYNARTGSALEEYYFAYCLHRIFDATKDSHVDLRNPNLFGFDYIVVDFDGQIYPTDEARMLSRINQIDLRIGDVSQGIDNKKRADLNASSFNHLDPDCIHCAYQAYCGVDTVDDVSRYGRIDIPRGSTWFCQRHTEIFDMAFSGMYGHDSSAQASILKWLGLSSLSPDILLRYDDTAPH